MRNEEPVMAALVPANIRQATVGWKVPEESRPEGWTIELPAGGLASVTYGEGFCGNAYVTQPLKPGPGGLVVEMSGYCENPKEHAEEMARIREDEAENERDREPRKPEPSPYDIWRAALDSGEFVEDGECGSLRVLRRL